MAVTLAPPLLRAIVCPDPATWAAVGTDLRDLGFDPVTSPRRADTLVTAERLPEGFAEPLREALDRLGGSHQLLAGAPLGGRPVEELLQLTAEADEGEDAEDADGRHGDMMAVTGDPSDDGHAPIDHRIELTHSPVEVLKRLVQRLRRSLPLAGALAEVGRALVRCERFMLRPIASRALARRCCTDATSPGG